MRHENLFDANTDMVDARITYDYDERLEKNILRIGIVDADLIGRAKHRFPNLASMKISGYYKDQGHNVELITNYDALFCDYDKVFISKVFTDTAIPDSILTMSNVECGGTGFFYDKAPPLPVEIEHHMPDYHLYDEWVQAQIADGKKKDDFKYYLDYSIGFTTRGCFRQCEFCVNQNFTRVQLHSPLNEFLDPSRKKICLLDDNVFGSPHWKEIFEGLRETGKPFQYKQGLDERLLNKEKCEVLFNCKYDGDYIFAFDNIADYDLIKSKLELMRPYSKRAPKFYTFCGFDRNDQWDLDFWRQDIFDLMERIKLLMEFHCVPYIMRFNRYIESPYQGMYKTLAAWCNQPSLFKNMSLREFCIKTGINTARYRYIDDFEKLFPEIGEYYDMKWKK